MSAEKGLQRQKLEVTRADGSKQIISARKRRAQETATRLVANGARGVSSMSHPGLRLSHYIFILRTEYGWPIHMEKVRQPSGIGWYGRYTLREKITLRTLDETRPTRLQPWSVSNPKSKQASNGGSDEA